MKPNIFGWIKKRIGKNVSKVLNGIGQQNKRCDCDNHCLLGFAPLYPTYDDCYDDCAYDTFQAGENFGIGRQTGMTDPTGSTTIKYNNRGRAFEKTSFVAA